MKRRGDAPLFEADAEAIADYAGKSAECHVASRALVDLGYLTAAKEMQHTAEGYAQWALWLRLEQLDSFVPWP